MLNLKKIRDKKSQIGSTLTWMVGFLIIVFILVLFIYATFSIAKVKGIASNIKQFFSFSESASSYLGINPFNQYTLFILNYPNSNMKNRTIIQSINDYFHNNDKNDIKCLFLRDSEYIRKKIGYYPALYIDNQEISPPFGENCEELPQNKLILRFVSNKAVHEAFLVFYNCDEKITKNSFKPSWWNKLLLKYEIQKMEENNQFYDPNCNNLTEKKELLIQAENLNFEPKMLVRSSEELNKIEEILDQNKNLNLSGTLFIYNSSLMDWQVKSIDTLVFVGKDSMRKNLIGEEGNDYLDVLNVKEEESVITLNWKSKEVITQ